MESLEDRALLSVTTISQSWKPLDFAGAVTISGRLSGKYGKYPVNGKFSGNMNVVGVLKYTSTSDATGSSTASGPVSGSIAGFGPLPTTDFSGQTADGGTAEKAYAVSQIGDAVQAAGGLAPGALGRAWHENGRMLSKMNTFTDFIACAEHLIKEGYTSSDRLAVRGKSAGGLLMGSVVTMRPDLFKAVVAEVPFVDAINSMLNDSIPLTAGEFEEWGNPKKLDEYRYIKAYSPYENIRATSYPHMLVTSAWNDCRVQYWEPTKFVAKMRATKTDDNLLVLKTSIVQGHSGAAGRYDAPGFQAFIYGFILDRLGIKK